LKWKDGQAQAEAERNQRIAAAKEEQSCQQPRAKPAKQEEPPRLNAMQLSRADYERVKARYGLPPDESRLCNEPPAAERVSADAFLAADDARRAEATRRREEALKKLPRLDGKNASVEEVAARAALYGVNTAEMGLLPPLQPLTAESKDQGRKVFGNNPAEVRAKALDAELRWRLGRSEQAAKDQARIAAASQKVTLTPKPESATTYPGEWPPLR